MSRSDSPAQKRPRVVILGSGFAGAYCALELQKSVGEMADLLVLDRNNYFVFHPLLVEAGVGSLEPRHVVVPIRAFLTRTTRFRMAEVTGVEPDRQLVRYRMVGEDAERTVEYDHLVIALGSVTNLPPVQGLREYACEVKTLGDSVALRDRMVQLLELANVTADNRRRRAMLHLVVVGANYTGVEVAGEFNEFLREGARYYRNLNPSEVQVTVVEKLGRILPTMRPSLARFAQRKMEAEGIEFRLETTTREIGEDFVELANGERLEARTVVWCAGIAQNPYAAALPFPKDERGFILCKPTGQVEGFENVWAIGDTSVNPRKKGGAYPPTAQAGTRLGKSCARNIVRLLRGQDPKPIDFKDLGAISAIGNRRAVAELLGVPVSGFIAWWLWRTVYLLKMPGLGRKLRVALDWTIQLFFSRDIVQLGLRRRPPRK